MLIRAELPTRENLRVEFSSFGHNHGHKHTNKCVRQEMKQLLDLL